MNLGPVSRKAYFLGQSWNSWEGFEVQYFFFVFLECVDQMCGSNVWIKCVDQMCGSNVLIKCVDQMCESIVRIKFMDQLCGSIVRIINKNKSDLFGISSKNHLKILIFNNLF